MAQTETSARALIREVYNNAKNIMTPDVIRYGWKAGFAWELSTGTGLRQQPIYGVTVVAADGTKEYDMSCCFHSLAAAREYIGSSFDPELRT